LSLACHGTARHSHLRGGHRCRWGDK
jgi:hypothetical protein